MQREGFGIRFLAVLIDVVILIVVMVIASLIFGGSIVASFRGGSGDAAKGSAVVAAIVMALIPLAYSLMEIFMAATPGKMALGLKIADQSGAPAPIPQLATRWVVKNSGSLLQVLAAITTVGFLATLGGLAGLAIFIGCFFVLGVNRQSFHDMAAKTAVFKKGPAMINTPPGV